MVRFYTYLEVYLDDAHKKVSLSEFEKHFRRPHQTIKAHLQEFVNAKILGLDKKPRFAFYGLNKSNPLLKEYLVLCEKERLLSFLESNILFKRLYEVLALHMAESKVLIFGSAVQKRDFVDIDLLILSGSKELRRAIGEFMKTYSVKMHIVQTDEKHLTGSFVAEIKKKHIMLSGHDYFIARLYGNELGLV